ncbi:MAG: WbqC family protein [Holosporaceae bacterium]|jgi:hypothetical protein|nr:WbqC family protein [Holosporaceae bacterium]
MKCVVISQPRYLPAINYLQRLYCADLFVFLDNVQRQSRGWENRNKILQNNKETWITIPVSSSSREIINKSVIFGTDWVDEHKNIIRQTYIDHPYFSNEALDKCYKDIGSALILSDYNYAKVITHMLLNICSFLGFNPNVALASENSGQSTTGANKLVQIIKNVNGDIYVSGANGKKYDVVRAFSANNIKVMFHNYVYPRYPQYNSMDFHPWMCFFDILFNVGLEKVGQLIKKEWILVE